MQLSLLQSIEQTDILIVREMPRFLDMNEDFVFPHIVLTLILSGRARAMYDMRVIEHRKNDLAIILPGHVMRPMDCSDDFSYALLFISPKMLDDLRFHTFSHDHEKFNAAPVCSLTDEQAAHLSNWTSSPTTVTRNCLTATRRCWRNWPSDMSS